MITPARLRAVRAAIRSVYTPRCGVDSVKLAPRLSVQRARWNSTVTHAPPADEAEVEKIRPFVDTRTAKAHHGRLPSQLVYVVTSADPYVQAIDQRSVIRSKTLELRSKANGSFWLAGLLPSGRSIHERRPTRIEHATCS